MRKDKWHIISDMHELSAGKYVEIQRICKGEGEDIDKSTAILRVLTGWSEGDIESLSLTEYAALVSGAEWLYAEPKAVEPKTSYNLGDYDLRLTDAEAITFAQFVDFQAFAKDVDAHFIELLSVVLVPQGKRYGDGYSIKDVRKCIARSLPADDALAVIAFFLHNAQLSLSSIATSLEGVVQSAPSKTVAQTTAKARAMTMLRALRGGGAGN